VKAWPETASELIELQLELATESPPRSQISETARIGTCFVCFQRGPSGPGSAGDAAWAAASLGETQVASEGIAPRSPTAQDYWRCARGRCSSRQFARSPRRPRSCSSTRPGATILAGQGRITPRGRTRSG